MQFFKNFFASIGVLFSIMVITTIIAYAIESNSNKHGLNKASIDLGIIQYGYTGAFGGLFYISIGSK